MGMTRDKLIFINRSTSSLPIKISMAPISIARWQLLLVLESSFKQMQGQ